MKNIIYKTKLSTNISQTQINKKSVITTAICFIIFIPGIIFTKTLKPLFIASDVFAFFWLIHLLMGYKAITCPNCKKKIIWTGFTKSGQKGCCSSNIIYEKKHDSIYKLEAKKSLRYYKIISHMPSTILSLLIYYTITASIIEKLCSSTKEVGYINFIQLTPVLLAILLSTIGFFYENKFFIVERN